MSSVRAISMSTSTNKIYSAKTASSVNNLVEIRRWLKINCKSRWHATDYRGDLFNWRKLSKLPPNAYAKGMDITIMVHFKKAEDLMLYLLSWPSEVLLNE
jgi:hypothetical protein